MGGANAGDIASELAANTFIDHIDENLEYLRKKRTNAAIMKDAVLAANGVVFDKSLDDAEFGDFKRQRRTEMYELSDK